MAAGLNVRTHQPTTRGQLTMVIVPLVFLILATISFGLRVYARRLKRLRLFVDDYLALLALAVAYGGYASALVMVLGGGVGLDIYTLDHSTLVIFIKSLGANYVLWLTATAAVQLSVLCFYTRVFGVRPLYRYTCYGTMALVVGWWISGFISELTACIPLSAIWTHGEKAVCINDDEVCSAIGLIHVVFDFAIVALPIPMLLRLQMARHRQLILTLVFMAGVFASICSILRMACLVNIMNTSPINKTGMYLTYLFQNIEAPIGILCTCVPSLPPVWADMSHSRVASMVAYLFKSHRSTDKDSSGSQGWHKSEQRLSFRRIDSRETQSRSNELSSQNVEPPLPLEVSWSTHRLSSTE